MTTLAIFAIGIPVYLVGVAAAYVIHKKMLKIKDLLDQDEPRLLVRSMSWVSVALMSIFWALYTLKKWLDKTFKLD